MKGKAVLIGAGALGLGFVAERLAADYNLVLVDVESKRGLLSAIQSRQGYALNLCRSDGLSVKRVAASFRLICTGDGSSEKELTRALSEADLVLTATSRAALPGVVSCLAPVLNQLERSVWLLFCENGPHISARYANHFAPNVVVVDTVMSRMCRFGEPGETAYTALWPDHDAALVVEEYAFLPIDSQVCSSGPFSSVFTLVSHEDFLRWRDIKLYMHNGMHAFVSYRASLEGVKFFPQVSQELRDEARLAVLEEVLPAILHAHPLTNRRELEEYGLGLLSRFFSPIFNDSIERGVRGARDKLAPNERLVGGCSFIRKAGIEPRHYSTAVDAARQVLALQDGEQASLLAEGR